MTKKLFFQGFQNSQETISLQIYSYELENRDGCRRKIEVVKFCKDLLILRCSGKTDRMSSAQSLISSECMDNFKLGRLWKVLERFVESGKNSARTLRYHHPPRDFAFR